jgi:ABC-type microcin C transport system permease subunit YejB
LPEKGGSHFTGEKGKDAILMQEVSISLGDSKRPFPRMLCLIHETITAAFAEEKAILLVDLLLQLFWVCVLHLIDQSLELVIHLPLGFQKNAVKVGKDPDMGHVNQTPRGESLPTPPTFTFFHGFVFLGLTSHIKKSLSH